MKTIQTTVYDFNELSETAKQTAIENRRIENYNYQYPGTKENYDTINAFEKVFPITIRDASYGGRGEGVYFIFDASDEIEDLTGQRLATYIWNNYRFDLFKGKYYSLWSKTEKSYKHYKDGYPVLKSRRSKVMLDNTCTLTGYYMDMEILDPVYSFLDKPRNINFKELLKECFDAWVKACNEDSEYMESDEYLREDLSQGDIKFLESGQTFDY